MTDAPPNQLSNARSAYLRSAMHQPVRWMEWGPEAFARAAAEDKPVLLDIGAVWCHWCHVMDRESYEDAETARLINEHFIAVKVDRDERPDVDSRYQAAVAAISGQGGWPLTVFLTPTGKPFFGGTYFPPADQHGRPGLRRVLMTMAEAFEQRRGEVDESAASVMEAIEQNETFSGGAANPGEDLIEKLLTSILTQFDPRFGGFGSQPKFPHSGALDLLIDSAGRAASRPRGEQARRASLVTLEKMSRGGIYDHLAGGFHRYSVDERWVVPHFEKMSYDNAGLLRNYVHAFQSFGEIECARIAHETIAWLDEWLSDREQGGFYASQDADESLDDDGDYFTWTRAEAAAALTADEMRVAAPWFDIGELGDMHHNPEKNCLHIDLPLAQVARDAGLTPQAAVELIRSAKANLYAARKLRKTPYIDKTIYVNWNGMLVSAYLEAGRVLAAPATTAFALKSLDRVLTAAWDGHALSHVVAYGETAQPGSLPGGLEDYAFTALACLDAWETTGQITHFESSLAIAEQMLARFHDRANGAFFDTEPGAGEQLGALSTRRKPIQDSPTPAGNAVAATLLLRLAELTGREDFRNHAKATLECFAGMVEHLGLYAASYGLALRRMVQPPVQVVVVGDDEAAAVLERAALAPYAANKTVVRLQNLRDPVPPTLAQTVAHLPPQTASFTIVCKDFTCGLPLTSPQQLAAALAP